ncbi:hypothetical protein [Mucilaginibacter myungsuensis]|uniref:DUF4251 domain-containing protein n=1 Tax=Mucilaginibacter myungsuensis TaxID=649104 RepID=A0A929L4M2_9SPHI|nr:hypothetical protein [Mucilaginibacter myungsuensis]MBE9663930.1 hypothetical protein [Mucilaginibacter myungsuensis]MDN3598354.1 hypothetical protein [Mucilaginibacter myungsuensis]
MKTFTQNLRWTLATVMVVIVAFASCKKDTQNEAVDAIVKQEELKKKIADIIPKQYQDTLAKLGLVLNTETAPPALEGSFAFKPLRLLKSNRPQDSPNLSFADASVRFFAQDKDNNIKIIGNNLLNTADTSIVTAISGTGNSFTVYGKVKSVAGTNSAIFGIIISGEKNGATLSNIRYGIINIDNSNGGTRFIKQGDARAVFDTDFVSQAITF